MRLRLLPLISRAISQGGEVPVLPDYAPLEPFPSGAPDAMLDGYTRRFSDLATYYESERSRLSAFVDGAAAESSEIDRPALLGPGPRAVPASYQFAEMMRGYWIVLRWVLFPPIFMVFAMLIGVTSTAHPLLSLVLLLPLSVYASIRASRRIEVLRRGEVPQIVSRTLGYGSGRMRNWPMTFTRGWKTEVRSYSGSGHTTQFQYRTSRGVFGTASISGVEYFGVLVVDPERADLAYGVPDFGSMPRPDARGLWDPSMPLRVWMASFASLGLVVAWMAVCIGLTVMGADL